jgi:CO dehydrogenase maturation factor
MSRILVDIRHRGEISFIVSKIAITGKGGVGKTTLTSLLAYTYAQQDRQVLVIDADPNANLAEALGIPDAQQRITPVVEMEDLIAERTGATPGTYGAFFKMNPRVDDIPDRFSVIHRGIRLLVMGTVDHGGSGCVCPESVVLKSLVTHLLIQRDEMLIMDMEAGIEHLGRATAQAVDSFVIVVEPGRRSIQTARTIRRLAQEIGIPRIVAVGNKVRGPSDEAFIVQQLPDFSVLGFLPYSSDAIEADLRGLPIFDAAPNLVAQARVIARALSEPVQTD